MTVFTVYSCTLYLSLSLSLSLSIYISLYIYISLFLSFSLSLSLCLSLDVTDYDSPIISHLLIILLFLSLSSFILL
jgi:hypothetical protein